jgi:acetyl esterase/lipase
MNSSSAIARVRPARRDQPEHLPLPPAQRFDQPRHRNRVRPRRGKDRCVLPVEGNAAALVMAARPGEPGTQPSVATLAGGYAQRLLQAGVSVELHQWPGTFHGSQAIPSADVSQRQITELGAALRRALAD